MKWFHFYTMVRPCLSCFAVLVTIADFLTYTHLYLSNWWLLLYFGSALAQPVLAILVAIRSSGNHGDYGGFVRFVKGVLLYETISMAYQAGVEQYVESTFDFLTALVVAIIIFIIGYFTWYRLNVKYFEKRMVIVHDSRTAERPACFTRCKSCGYRNKNFFDACPQCGKYAKEYVYLNKTPVTGKTPVNPPIAKEAPAADSIRFCRKCGARLVENGNFCGKCGTEIIKE